ncbi:MAG TPA: septum formation initiator family protein [Nitrolancea sp.]|nr:septum formation initiator family protein [Nitrolancea sp.]
MADVIANLVATLHRMRGRLVIVLVLIVGAYFLVAFGEQAWKARQLEGEVAERQSAVDELTQQKQQLQAQLDQYSSDQYLAFVEQKARQDLNLSRPGEHVLLVRWTGGASPTPAASATATPEPPHKANWDKWLDLFGLR